ncbi:hypothetical protein [Streptosporangium sp. NPDC003464]
MVEIRTTAPNPDKKLNTLGRDVWRIGQTCTLTVSELEPLLSFTSQVPSQASESWASCRTPMGSIPPILLGPPLAPASRRPGGSVHCRVSGSLTEFYVFKGKRYMRVHVQGL